MRPSAVKDLTLIIVAALLAACDTPRIAPRHVVLISIDTLRRDRLPCYGHPGDTAPFITELAAQSVVFDNAIAAASLTAPSRTMLREQLRSRLESWFGESPKLLHELPETLLPNLKPKFRKALEELGYIERSSATDQAP